MASPGLSERLMETLAGSHGTHGVAAKVSLPVLFQYQGDAKVGEDIAGIDQSIKHLGCQLNQVTWLGCPPVLHQTPGPSSCLDFVDSKALAH